MTLPVLVMNPLSATVLPETTRPGGQVCETAMDATVATGQEAVSVMLLPWQVSKPLTVMDTEQVLKGTV